MKPTLLASIIFAIIAVAHLLRLLFGWAVIVGTMDVPMWPSALVVLVFGGLSLMLWKETRA